MTLTLVLPRALKNFSLSPLNQKESELSHQGGRFDEKKIEGTTLPGTSVSRQRPLGGGGWWPPEKI